MDLGHLDRLRKAKTLIDFAPLLGFTPSGLSYVLYKLKPETLYTTFDIPKAGGGNRTINAPKPELKLLQQRLGYLLSLCLVEIEEKYPVRRAASHGFVKGRSIVTNAKNHRKKRYVLNLDISDFFGSINFGRVRGYFVRDREFTLDPAVATIIAQIACYKNALPQGSPCSPVLSNLIGAILDRRLIELAKRYRCTYTRYADDITFSTNERNFPRGLALPRLFHGSEWRIGRALKKQIVDSGFLINPNKTRMQIVGSRQATTGLIVNEKVNISKEYYLHTRSMCHLLFRTGKYHRPGKSDEITDLAPIEGRLAFMYHVKGRHDRSEKVNKTIGFVAPTGPHNLYQRFLLYKYCVANSLPTIITEGRSDTIYLASAIKALASSFPTLVSMKDGKVVPAVTFLRHSENNGRLLHLNGGTGGIGKFIHLYKNHKNLYLHAPMLFPVIIIVDNDKGAADGVFKAAAKAYGVKIEFGTADPYFHLGKNLYLVKTPVGPAPSGESCIEDLFPADVLDTKLNGKPFDKNKVHEDHSSYGKIVFADRVIRPQASKIDFTKFNSILGGVAGAISHYAAIGALAVGTVATGS